MLSIFLSLSCSGKNGATNRYRASFVEFKKHRVSKETFSLQLEAVGGVYDDIISSVSVKIF